VTFWGRLKHLVSPTKPTPIANSDRQIIRHQVINAALGIHRERLAIIKSSNAYFRSLKTSYDTIGKHLERIEHCLEQQCDDNDMTADMGCSDERHG
jgi:hypothetical protein